MENNGYNDRFKDAPWYEGCKNDEIIIGGMGGIGSNALYFLYKTIPAKRFYIFDDDVVEEHNIGSQFFMPKHIGESKVKAIRDILLEFEYKENVSSFFSKILNNVLPISIAGFDNMEARKQMYNNWKQKENREIFIDGRLEANIYQIFVVTPGEREEWYEKTLFDDTVVPNAPCTFKQTSYVAGLIGARITHILVNYLSNKYMKEDVFNIPYLVEENTEPFVIKTLYNENI